MKEWVRRHAPGLAYAYKAAKEIVAPSGLSALDRGVLDAVCPGEIRVMRGPFAEMRYVSGACGSAFPAKLIGCYEEELHGWIEELLALDHERIVDIGAAEGYYAVGFARRAPNSQVHAFDTDPIARYYSRRLARLNGVAGRMRVRGTCTHEDLGALAAGGDTLVICDCEGAEVDLLDPVAVPGLRACDILVEFHEHLRPGGQDLLQARFSETHALRNAAVQPRRPERYPEVSRLSAAQREYALYERPDCGQQWGLFLTRSR